MVASATCCSVLRKSNINTTFGARPCYQSHRSRTYLSRYVPAYLPRYVPAYLRYPSKLQLAQVAVRSHQQIRTRFLPSRCTSDVNCRWQMLGSAMERALDVSTPLIATRWCQSPVQFVDLGCFNVVSCERLRQTSHDSHFRFQFSVLHRVCLPRPTFSGFFLLGQLIFEGGADGMKPSRAFAKPVDQVVPTRV